MENEPRMNECKKCGRELYEAILKAWPDTTSFISKSTLPELPLPNITMPRESVKKYNAQFLEMGEFIALVCGVEMKNLCRADMLKYLATQPKENADHE